MAQKYKRLREQILTLHDLHNKWSPSNIADELQNSDCPPSQTRRALVRYIKYTINRGTANPQRRSGRPRTTRTPQFISLVKRNVENQRRKSIRKTDKLLKNHQLKSSYGSVQRALKHDIKIKPWKITRAQKITPEQRNERIKCTKILLKKFGKTPTRSYSKWKRLINTDFSGRINLIQKHNSKNNIVWSRSKATIPLDLQTIGQQKYSLGIILFGAISSRGLIPKKSPIFIDEWLKFECKKLNKKRISMDRFLYIKLIKQKLKPRIDRLYNNIPVIWQDGADPKHRSRYALDKIQEIFHERIEPEEQKKN
ncbi:unnamed protein product [Rotaria sordida]|uniref:Uncharacterized protein n=1 Tax=Rotaria sordida TaxID=392033 RepID=A0A815U9P3_9BILA|nr:unnamed protein product [Rotaria sordida]CAF4239539.1 unnamed protein product [Rotaria sordida]